MEVLGMKETQNEGSERLGAQECDILAVLLIDGLIPLTIYLSDHELYIDF